MRICDLSSYVCSSYLLDYEREVRHMRLYQHMLRDEKGVHVADLLPELSTRRLLTMTWLEGKPLIDFAEQSKTVKQRNTVAMNMFRAWYVPFYSYEIGIASCRERGCQYGLISGVAVL